MNVELVDAIDRQQWLPVFSSLSLQVEEAP